MRIAVNTRLLLNGKLEGIGRFSYEVLSRMAAAHPEVSFTFLFDRPFDPEFVFAPNVTPVVLWPPARHPFLFVFWFEIRVYNWLRKNKPDLFLSPDGYLSLRSKIPSVAVIHDLNFEHYPRDLPFLVRKYYRWFFPRFAAKATRIATVSEFSSRDIRKCYGIPAENIDVVHNGVNDIFHPLGPEHAEAFRAKWTGGKEFFLAVGSIHPRKNVSRIIQAFDRFRTGNPGADSCLLLVGNKYWWNNEMGQVLQQSRFSQDIIFTGRISDEELAGAYNAAIALVYVSYFEGFGIPLLEAMQSGCPVIAANATSLPEIAGNAACLVDPFDTGDISNAMDIIRRNPELRERLVQHGVQRAAVFSWKSSSQKLWECIEKAILQ